MFAQGCGNVSHYYVGERERNKRLSASESEKFSSLFGTTPYVCAALWNKLIQHQVMPKKGSPPHLLWAFIVSEALQQ